MRRIVATIVCLAAFLVMASIFVPAASPAARAPGAEPADEVGSGAAPPRHEEWPSADPHEGLRSLGSLEAGEYLVTIYATSVGPRYTISQLPSHEELGALLSLDQVERSFPDLPLRRLVADDGSALMLAEPMGE
jgi:hypothetical protein